MNKNDKVRDGGESIKSFYKETLTNIKNNDNI